MADNERECNLNVIRMIQISKDISTKDISVAFGVTPSAIYAVKNGIRSFKLQTLRKGLSNLGIPLTSYVDLEEFKDSLEKEKIDNYSKFICMLAKTIGTLYPENKELAERIIYRYFQNPLER